MHQKQRMKSDRNIDVHENMYMNIHSTVIHIYMMLPFSSSLLITKQIEMIRKGKERYGE